MRRDELALAAVLERVGDVLVLEAEEAPDAPARELRQGEDRRQIVGDVGVDVAPEGRGRHELREPDEAAAEVRERGRAVPPRSRVHSRRPRHDQPTLLRERLVLVLEGRRGGPSKLRGGVPALAPHQMQAPVHGHVPQPRIDGRDHEQRQPARPDLVRALDHAKHRHEQRKGVLRRVPQVDEAAGRVADVRVLPQTLREAEPDGEERHGGHEDLLVPERVRLGREFVQRRLVLVREAERAAEEEVRDPDRV
mmetsp:Transcript_21634/g.66500  ORF Transcript_21634/g.66500 Transcript_21634/m.66500 type:complete len:251 (-) Transcript_21634:1885-2637(-)